MNANVELYNDPNGPPLFLQVDIAFCRPPIKLREGPLSFCSLGGGGGGDVCAAWTITYDALALSPYMFKLVQLMRPHCMQGPAPSPDMFKPVYYEKCMAAKRVFKTLLECFLIAFVFA